MMLLSWKIKSQNVLLVKEECISMCCLFLLIIMRKKIKIIWGIISILKDWDREDFYLYNKVGMNSFRYTVEDKG